MLLQRGIGDQPQGPRVDRNLSEIFAQDAFRLGKLPERRFGRSLEIITCPESRKSRANMIQYSIRRGILLLLVELKRTKVICHKIIRNRFEDRIEILVGRFKFPQSDVGVSAAQMRLQILGIDLESVVEKAHPPHPGRPGFAAFPL